MKNLTNQRFGRQVAIKHVGFNKYHNALWLCRCDCGNEHVVSQGKLSQGKSTSCGCYKRQLSSERLTKHGITKGNKKPRIFNIWNNMKARCFNPNDINFHNYGGRGICVCEEWLSFENFYNWAIANGYSDNLTLDRVDNNKEYCPANCQWVEWENNRIKQRRYTLLTVQGVTKALTRWAKDLNLNRHRLMKFFQANGKEATEIALCERVMEGQGAEVFHQQVSK